MEVKTGSTALQALQLDLSLDGVVDRQVLFRLARQVGVEVVLQARPTDRVQFLATDKPDNRRRQTSLRVDPREVGHQSNRLRRERYDLFRHFLLHPLRQPHPFLFTRQTALEIVFREKRLVSICEDAESRRNGKAGPHEMAEVRRLSPNLPEVIETYFGKSCDIVIQ